MSASHQHPNSDKKRLVVLTGSGISAESGITTFRDAGGLWENYSVMDVASIEGWYKNPELVLDFYNQRRHQLSTVEPNQAHKGLAALEGRYHVQVITQNVDDLHERAGSTNILHLHGELTKACSSRDKTQVETIGTRDISWGEQAKDGSQLRPFIVWFGEAVPAMDQAIEWVSEADLFVIIGTSLNVYPAAGLVDYVPHNCPIYLIDPNEVAKNLPKQVHIIREKAVEGVRQLRDLLTDI